MLNDAAEQACSRVLTAFRLKPRMCIHMLLEASNLPRATVRQALQVLIKRGDVLLKSSEGSFNDRIYELANSDLVIELPEGTKRLPELFGLEEGVARSRVLLLKRFRDRMHSELHPTLNLIISDYERGLRAVEVMRGDDDDFLET